MLQDWADASADASDEYITEMAGRLAAAAISTQLGLKSIDYTHKQYIRDSKEDIGGAWRQMARLAIEIMNQSQPV